MLRYLWSTLRHSPLRPAVLAIGLLVAAVSFSLLTAAVQTSRADVQGTLNQNFRAAYDILVRPAGSQTDIERSSGLVRPNFQSGIYGGVTDAQWQQVLAVPGVAVAAPLANVGMMIPFAQVPIEVPEAEGLGAKEHLYRVSQSWSAVRGTSRYQGPRDFIYSTTDQLGCGEDVTVKARVDPPAPRSAFDVAGPKSSLFLCYVHGQSLSGAACWQLQPNYFDTPGCGVQAYVTLAFPLAIAGIDPVQESKLLGLDRTIVSGRALSEDDTFSASDKGSVVPVIASSRTYADADLQLAIDRVELPAGKTTASLLRSAGPATGAAITAGTGAYRLLRSLPVTAGRTVRLNADQLYTQALDGILSNGFVNEYWTAGPISYDRRGDGLLRPRSVQQDPNVFTDGKGTEGYAYVNPASSDVQYRNLNLHLAADQTQVGNTGHGGLDMVGRFDPAKLPHFSALSEVPLETYNPSVAQAGDAATKQVLGDAPYRPTLNLGGYLAQPPQLLTTLTGVRGLTSSKYYQDGTDDAPISVIRVRVAGVTGTDDVSITRIKTVAAEIARRTGLDVDITAGSSPQPQLVQLQKSPSGTPALLLRENWVAKGVAVAILSAADRKSLILLAMILLVTAVFLLNAGVAAVRARRTELGMLLCMGWRPRQVFATVLGELTVVGVLAGTLGTGLAFGLSTALHLHQPAWRLALVAPVSIGLAVLAGLIPAAVAARGAPLDVVAPPVTGPRRPPRLNGLTGLAIGNLRGARGRTLLAALALYIGVAALAGLAAVSLAFRGTVVGTLLGNVIAVQVRGTDYIIVALILLLAAVALTDVLVLGMRERAVELVTLRVVGWSDGQLARLVLTEGLVIGVTGAGLGAVTGAALGLLLGAPTSTLLAAAALSAAAGLAVAALASLGPALTVSRLPIGVASAEA